MRTVSFIKGSIVLHHFLLESTSGKFLFEYALSCTATCRYLKICRIQRSGTSASDGFTLNLPKSARYCEETEGFATIYRPIMVFLQTSCPTKEGFCFGRCANFRRIPRMASRCFVGMAYGTKRIAFFLSWISTSLFSSVFMTPCGAVRRTPPQNNFACKGSRPAPTAV